MQRRQVGRPLAAAALMLLLAVYAHAQDTDQQTHDMPQMDMSLPSWHFMQDGVLNLLANHQGGPRGGDEFRVPNWWMGMLSRSSGRGRLMLTGMFSLDPATVGRGGYRELFQSGEAIDGRPNVDRQHPHDAFMQVSASWSMQLSESTTMTLTAAPAGEPALGPIAFMHRASAAAIVLAPLSHHTFDSTHISFGVLTAGLSNGRWSAEGSVFNGREPDDDRWNFDFGSLDSVAGRLWFRPKDEWAIQVSSGHLVHPEQLEHGNIARTTTSTAWTRVRADALTAVTVGYGRNDPTRQQALFGEATRQRGPNTISSRLEFVQIESELFLDGTARSATDDRRSTFDTIAALTVGGTRRLGRWSGVEAGLGANVTAFAVPSTLRASHGEHPLSFQVFLQIRPHVGGMGPMWNMRMGE